MKIIQIVEGYRKGDGVSNAVASVDAFFERHNVKSVIFKRSLVDSDLNSDFFQEEDIVFYHLAFSLDPLVKKLRCKKVLLFHNITKPELLENYDEESRVFCASGWYDVKRTKDFFEHAIAFSDYSKRCLIENGWDREKISVLPIYIRTDRLNMEPDSKVIQKYEDNKINILFTGRVYPNKKHEDLIAAFAAYKKKYNKNCRLLLVGSIAAGCYYPSLLKYAEKLGVSEDVIFTDRVSLTEYIAYFKIANIFLCMSEHEGFCIPLVEAMFFDLPIVAYNSTAVPDTLGGAGVLLEHKNMDEAAYAIHKLMSDNNYQKNVLCKQQKRLEELSGRNIENEYEAVFTTIMSECRNTKKNVKTDTEHTFERVETLPWILNNTNSVVIYGAGVAGARLYSMIRPLIKDVIICDNGRAGEYDEELDCIIYSPKETVITHTDHYYVVSVQNRKVAFEIASELLEAGINKDKICFYDKMQDQIL